MKRYVSSLALGAGAAVLLLVPAGCAERTPAVGSAEARPAALMECNPGRINCRELTRYSTIEICSRERAAYLARNPLREAYCTRELASR